MKKVILTLLVSLSCVMIANAQDPWNPPVIDTLPKRIINGLEVIPIKFTYETGQKTWKLRPSNFEKCFQKFESKYPGFPKPNSQETEETIQNWKDSIWPRIVPATIKVLRGLDIRIFVNKEGQVFTVEFMITDDAFSKLESLPQNTLKNLYDNLMKEKCEAYKNVEFIAVADHNNAFSHNVWGSSGAGKEYTYVTMPWIFYGDYGTMNQLKMRDKTSEKHTSQDEQVEKNPVK